MALVLIVYALFIMFHPLNISSSYDTFNYYLPSCFTETCFLSYKFAQDIFAVYCTLYYQDFLIKKLVCVFFTLFVYFCYIVMFMCMKLVCVYYYTNGVSVEGGK